MLEDVSEKLVKEDRHFVRFDRSRISDVEMTSELIDKLEYQRMFVPTNDGGVISLDMPANLKMDEDDGLDTTFLLVPGGAEGSMDRNVRMFVLESLKRGCFPVVLNPRGCAGSTLTTTRMFTAADSEDVCKAVQFISKMRSRTTIMGVGWGYGANMLTKYLAEVGDKTPLRAATCINNPFDLEEFPKTSSQQLFTDQKLLKGLKDILRSNKEIFQGRKKGFEVEKALLSGSVREFESFISMVSYGFQTIQDFYSACSSKYDVKDLRIPVLFIQSEKETLPIFSAPHSLIAENPCTSLLLCSSLPSGLVDCSGPVVSGLLYLTFEWLTSVELGLLKGHHPLMENVDVGLRLMRGRRFNERGQGRLLDYGQQGVSNDNSMSEMLDQKAVTTTVVSKPGIRSQRYSGQESVKPQQLNSPKFEEESSVDANSMKENEGSAVETERGQVLQTAKLVLNMLDVTMPGTLAPEQKQKVLTAVTKGETVLKALQDAVPEDARGKLTTTVSEILRSGKDLKLDGLLNAGRNSKVLSAPTSVFDERVKETSKMDDSSFQKSIDGAVNPEHTLDATSLGNKQPDGGNDVQHPRKEKIDVQSQSNDKRVDQDADSISEASMDDVTGNVSKDKVAHSDHDDTPSYSDQKEKVNVNGEVTKSLENALGNKEPSIDQHQGNEDLGTPQTAAKEESYTQNTDEKAKDSSADPIEIEPPAEIHPVASSSKSDQVDVEKERDERDTQLVQDNSKTDLLNSVPPSINISEAVDALTGMDDSTQVAVNSVFGVIEGMITQLEEKTEKEKVSENGEDIVEEKPPHSINNNCDVEERGDSINQQHTDSSSYDYSGDSLESPNGIINEKVHEKIVQGAPQPEKDINLSHNLHLSCKEKDDDWVGSSNPNCTPHKVTNLSETPRTSSCLEKNVFSNLQETGVLVMSTPPSPSPSLDYSPEKEQRKLLEQPGISEDFDKSSRSANSHSSSVKMEKLADTDLLPANTILNTERPKKHDEGQHKENDYCENDETKNESTHDLDHLVKSIIMDSLEADVLSKVSEADMKEISNDLAKDLELVSNVILQAIRKDNIATWSSIGRCVNNDSSSMICGNLRAGHIVTAVSSTVQKTNFLRRILPVGVIVNSSVAALNKYFSLSIGLDSAQGETPVISELNSCKQMGANVSDQKNAMEIFQASESIKPDASENIYDEKYSFQNESIMAGAVTAAVGASNLLMQNPYAGDDRPETEPNSPTDETAGTQNNLVTSIAEKAMAVAGPVVPVKEDGAVDQDRLVSMLANVGQNGGILKLVGKAALLWGGVRGAMSLTHKLISFFHLSKRPLFQRIVGFVGMVILLWSPVYIPLLPTLVRGWATKSPSKSAELSCVIGLYVAVTVLIMMWGKRIRGYERPLQQYGLDFTLPKFKSFIKAYIGGALVVLSIQYVNLVIGCASLSWQACLPLISSTWPQEVGKILLLVAQGTINATGLVLVEELLFRSWLPAEISKEFGFHLGIIVAGFTFSLIQRSLIAIPGLWLLSLALAGAKQRSQGSLSAPIGLRAGIMTTTYVLQKGGFFTYQSNFPLWIRGMHPVQPFSGISGLAFSILLAVFLYPRQPNDRMKVARVIRE